MKKCLLIFPLVGCLLPIPSGFAAPVPQVRLVGVPTEVMIGGSFSFRIYFSNVGGQAGFVPYIDLAVDAAGADGWIYNLPPCGVMTCDGLTVQPPASGPTTDARDATYNTPPFSAGFCNFTYNCDANYVAATHPLTGVLGQIDPCFGHSWAVIKLQNGVIQPGEPEVYVDVTINVSPLADRATPLRIQARGGFAYGTSSDKPTTPAPILHPDDNHSPCSGMSHVDPNPWTEMREVHPTLFTVAKTSYSHEGETATGPNNPCFYAVVVDVAAGQRISNLTINDVLPDNLKYLSFPFAGQPPGVRVVPLPGPGGVPPNYFVGGTLAGFTPNLLVENVDYTKPTRRS
jgi:hypothetical protein